MAASARYRNLHTRINALKTRFLHFDNVDSFQAENQDKLMSFHLLVHAEIEYFFEEYARFIIIHLRNAWTARKKIFPSLRYLFLYSPNKYDPTVFIPISDRILNCCTSFIARIDNNHGIKQSNIVSLFAPLGVTETYLDNIWLATMDAFGTRRGSYAHRSISVQTLIDKTNELNELNIVLFGIKKLDIKLQTLTRKTLRKPF